MRAPHLLQVPVLAQPSEYECGNTSLAIVAQYFGKHYSIGQLRELAGTTTVGTDHRNMITGAIATGATVFARSEGSVDELASFIRRGLPVIVGWWSMAPGDSHFDPTWTLDERRANDRGHYSVVCGVTASGLVHMDPERGLCELSEDSFMSVWYDTDTDAYERVERWFMVMNYGDVTLGASASRTRGP